MAFKDETGKRYGRLTVLHRDESKPSGHGYKVWWICKCDCGNIKSIKGENLRRGLTKSCGCLQKETASRTNFKDLSGQTFNNLIALYPSGKNKSGNTIWHCRCLNCGNYTDVSSGDLQSGHTTSCGCIGYSKGEYIIDQILTKKGIDFIKEYSFDDCRSNKNYKLRFDFAIFKENTLHCLIEYQGIQHYKPNTEFDIHESLEERQSRDNIKRKYCLDNKIKLIEIPYTDLNKITWEYLKEKCNL